MNVAIFWDIALCSPYMEERITSIFGVENRPNKKPECSKWRCGIRCSWDFSLSGVELSLSYGRRSVYQFILVSGSPLGPMTRFYPYSFFSDNCFVVLPVGRPLWWEDEPVTYSAIADWLGHWGPITLHYRLIWDCVPSSSPLTTRRDYGGGILTRLHTGKSEIFLLYHI
jgi:hypothetical protein